MSTCGPGQSRQVNSPRTGINLLHKEAGTVFVPSCSFGSTKRGHNAAHFALWPWTLLAMNHRHEAGKQMNSWTGGARRLLHPGPQHAGKSDNTPSTTT